jgi:aminoglycoside 3-N-acetyltransferase I
LEKFEQERREIFVYDLAVSEQHRRRGVAKNLILELKKIAKNRGAYLIFIQAERDDAVAIQLYGSFGVREDACHFDITVD